MSPFNLTLKTDILYNTRVEPVLGRLLHRRPGEKGMRVPGTTPQLAQLAPEEPTMFPKFVFSQSPPDLGL